MFKIILAKKIQNQYFNQETNEALNLPRVSAILGSSGNFQTTATIKGSQAHEYIARYLTNDISAGYLREIANSGDESAIASVGIIRQLQKYLTGIKWYATQVESSFAIEFEGMQGVGYCGTIDAILNANNTFIPVDFKTGGKYDKHKLQMQLYMYATYSTKGLIVYEDEVVEVEPLPQGEVENLVNAYFEGRVKGGKEFVLADDVLEKLLEEYKSILDMKDVVDEKLDAKKDEIKALLSDINTTVVGKTMQVVYTPPTAKKVVKKDVLKQHEKILLEDEANCEFVHKESGRIFKRIPKSKEKTNV